MKQLDAKVLYNERIAQDLYRMRVESSYLAKNIKPGQFVQIRCAEELDPLLRRPFSVHRILKNSIEILFEVVGKGTEILSNKKKGERLDVIGPLGTGFDVEGIGNRDQGIGILVAGGSGVASLVALAGELAKKKQKIYVIIGAKTKSHIVCGGDFKKLGAKVLVTTEDGSRGQKGLATDLLVNLLNAIRYPLNAIYACGPNEMLKTVSRIAQDRRVPCQVSLEEYMACGLGVCLGCPVKVKGRGYKMVCKDGPIFDAEEIAW